MAEGQEPHTPPPDKSHRAVILATIGIVVIMGLAMFYVAVVAPLRETHAAVRDFAASSYDIDIVEAALARLGGKERAARRLAEYLRLPGWIGTDRLGAMWFLEKCGPHGVPALIKELGDTNADVRDTAAVLLGLIGPEAKEAIPMLQKLVKDENPNVRTNAAEALRLIRGSAPAPDAPSETP